MDRRGFLAALAVVPMALALPSSDEQCITDFWTPDHEPELVVVAIDQQFGVDFEWTEVHDNDPRYRLPRLRLDPARLPV